MKVNHALLFLWKKLGVIPVNNDDEIEEDFTCYYINEICVFKKGTSKFEIWHWFDEKCPNNLHDDLMFN